MQKQREEHYISRYPRIQRFKAVTVSDYGRNTKDIANKQDQKPLIFVIKHLTSNLIDKGFAIINPCYMATAAELHTGEEKLKLYLNSISMKELKK